MSFSPGEFVAIAVAVISLVSVVLGKLVEKRTESKDGEEEREAEFSKDLWNRYKEVMAERDAIEKQNKDLKTVIMQNDEQLTNLKKQVDILLSEKVHWEKDRAEWVKKQQFDQQKMEEMQETITWLNDEIGKLRAAATRAGLRLEPASPPPNGA